MEKVDVIIPLGTGSTWEDNEIRYCLRSIEQNFLDLGEVYIVGYKPAWLINVIHISCEDLNKKNKDANLIRKVYKACQAIKSEEFLRLSDDQIILKPVSKEDIKPYHVNIRFNTNSASRWKQRLFRTLKLFPDPRNYESHVPMILNKNIFIETVNKHPEYELDGEGYTINTLYFNSVINNHLLMTSNIKAVFEMRENEIDKIQKDIEGKMYLGYNDKGLTSNLKNMIQSLFPDKSKFEI